MNLILNMHFPHDIMRHTLKGWRLISMLIEAKTATAGIALAALWAAEGLFPFWETSFRTTGERLRHDARNLALGLFNAAVILVLSSAILTFAVSWAETGGIGFLHMFSLAPWLETLLACVVFDFWMYLWHRANHSIPFLWRFHRMHHSDPAMDVTTGLRFHIGEIFLSSIARLAVVPLLGMTLGQVVLYEAVFLPIVLFHHSNVRLPRWLDHGLLALIVTPAMHRVHHSRFRPETDSNYGSVLPWWDLLARTFRLRQDARTIRPGLDGFDAREWQTIPGMMKTPLAGGGCGHSGEGTGRHPDSRSQSLVASE